MSVVTKFFNCNILKDGRILTQDLWVENGQIADPEIIFYDKKNDKIKNSQNFLF